MKTAFATLIAVSLIASTLMVARAEEEKKEAKTLKGTFGCAKCVFKLDGYTKCANAIKVKEKDAEVFYVLDDKAAGEPYHKAICTDSKEGSVKGHVEKKKEDEKYAKIKPEKDGVKYD